MDNTTIKTFPMIIDQQAIEFQEKEVYVFLGSGGVKIDSVTYGVLAKKVSQVSTLLLEIGLSGRRVLMLYEPGLEFIAAFLACLKVGAIAVPCHTAKPGRSNWKRLELIAYDCKAAALLSTVSHIKKLSQWLVKSPHIMSLPCFPTDVSAYSVPMEQCDPVKLDNPAFLQYTSGSTGNPKGVIVTHRNLLENARASSTAFGINSSSTVLCWLPPYHDWGLIGNILQSLYEGARCVLMSPTSFLQNPRGWLDAIGRYQADVMQAPNFAYELCTQRIKENGLNGLDLSSVKSAVVGAEPIRADTLLGFSERFSSVGFRAEAFRSAYGLAEATLIVTAGGTNGSIKYLRIDKSSMVYGNLSEETKGIQNTHLLVGCGRCQGSQKIVIVDPDSLQICREGRIGEIWIQGDNVARGYWMNDLETRIIFGATLPDFEGKFLKTGDLGAIFQGELFVTGRIKEVMNINGKNHYPQDIEHTVKNADNFFISAICAAFSINFLSGESVVLVQEFARKRFDKLNFEKLAITIKQAVFEEHGLKLSDIVFVMPGTIPKTSSGKIQRRMCRQLYLDGNLDRVQDYPSTSNDFDNNLSYMPDIDADGLLNFSCLNSYDVGVAADRYATRYKRNFDNNSDGQCRTNFRRKIYSEIRRVIEFWLFEHLGKVNIFEAVYFSELGIDSIVAAELTFYLERILNIKLDSAVIWIYPTIKQLSDFLSDQFLLKNNFMIDPAFS